MPDLRKDPITGRWVIISTDRARRPSDFSRESFKIKGGFCPFCPGNEDQTPPEILRLPAEPKWRVRVIPNLFPALGDAGDPERDGSPLFREMRGVGSHEVVVESPRHDARIDTMGPDEVSEIIRVWRLS